MQPSEEQVKFDIKANLKRGIEYVGGHLTITNERLYFKPHSLNIQKDDLVITIQDIKAIETAKILGISPNGIFIQLDDDTSYKFTVGMPWTNTRQKVIDYIRCIIT